MTDFGVLDRMRDFEQERRRCPLCSWSSHAAPYLDAIRRSLAAHLRVRHGARA